MEPIRIQLALQGPVPSLLVQSATRAIAAAWRLRSEAPACFPLLLSGAGAPQLPGVRWRESAQAAYSPISGLIAVRLDRIGPSNLDTWQVDHHVDLTQILGHEVGHALQAHRGEPGALAPSSEEKGRYQSDPLERDAEAVGREVASGMLLYLTPELLKKPDWQPRTPSRALDVYRSILEPGAIWVEPRPLSSLRLRFFTDTVARFVLGRPYHAPLRRAPSAGSLPCPEGHNFCGIARLLFRPKGRFSAKPCRSFQCRRIP